MTPYVLGVLMALCPALTLYQDLCNHGNASYTPTTTQRTTPSTPNPPITVTAAKSVGIILGGCLGALFVAIILLLVFRRRWKKRKSRRNISRGSGKSVGRGSGKSVGRDSGLHMDDGGNTVWDKPRHISKASIDRASEGGSGSLVVIDTGVVNHRRSLNRRKSVGNDITVGKESIMSTRNAAVDYRDRDVDYRRSTVDYQSIATVDSRRSVIDKQHIGVDYHPCSAGTSVDDHNYKRAIDSPGGTDTRDSTPNPSVETIHAETQGVAIIPLPVTPVDSNAPLPDYVDVAKKNRESKTRKSKRHSISSRERDSTIIK